MAFAAFGALGCLAVRGGLGCGVWVSAFGFSGGWRQEGLRLAPIRPFLRKP